MSIPRNITREHVLQAIEEININQYPTTHKSTKYDLYYNENYYPPKYVISIANRFANEVELPTSEFSGGLDEANKYLIDLGFDIVPKDDSQDSWSILGPGKYLKRIDKSSLIHHGTGIPHRLRNSFQIDKMRPGERIDVILRYSDKQYKAYFSMDRQPNPRTQLLWFSDFENVLASELPIFYSAATRREKILNTPSLCFEAVNSEYRDFIVTIIYNSPVLLEKYHDYDRSEVHDIFSPQTPFKAQTGTWGLQGIVKVPNRIKDYVLFVTFGQQQAGHIFDEGITEEGILAWQSQPGQDFQSFIIKDLINHNQLTDNIYLFLRTKKGTKYTYLGKLAYIDHDIERVKPVYFHWQILDWDISYEKLDDMNLVLALSNDTSLLIDNNNSLVLTDSPESRLSKKGISTKTFQARKTDFVEIEKTNKTLGLKGEELVIEYERNHLIQNNRAGLANDIIHVANRLGDGAGFDILSFDLDGNKKFIEVKTTKKGANTPFFVSENEVAFSNQYPNQFYLYRVYSYNEKNNSGMLFIEKGPLSNNFSLEPIQYRAIK